MLASDRPRSQYFDEPQKVAVWILDQELGLPMLKITVAVPSFLRLPEDGETCGGEASTQGHHRRNLDLQIYPAPEGSR